MVKREHIVVPAVLALVALAVMPGLARPFFWPKTAILAVGALVTSVIALWRRGPPPDRSARVLAIIWAASAVLSPLLTDDLDFESFVLEVAGALWILAALHADLDGRLVRATLAAAGSIVAAICVLQAAGVDPFHWLGFRPSQTGVRLRVYGTLGNPDFVSAYLGATLCLSAGRLVEHRRPIDLAGAILQLVALALAQSLATVLALACAGLYGLWRLSDRRRLGTAVAVALIALGVGLAGRDLSHVGEGRLYLWKVAAPHLRDVPVLGHGPGSVVSLWPEWEASYWRRAPPESERRFAAAQDHLHNDLLEWLFDHGIAGAMARYALVLLTLWRARKYRTAAAVSVGAALVALVARALVDFPLYRPAELGAFGVLIALCWRNEHEPEATRLRRGGPGLGRGNGGRAAEDVPGAPPRLQGEG